MTHRHNVARGRNIVARWCALAERRLEHLTELFETGRWRRYHSERAFLENIQEAKSAVEIWRDLVLQETSRDNSAIGISWPGHIRVMPPRDDTLRGQVHRFQLRPLPIAAEPPRRDVSMSLQAVRVSSDQAPSVLAMDAPALEPRFDPALNPALDNASELTLDIAAVIQQRYPLLRNAL